MRGRGAAALAALLIALPAAGLEATVVAERVRDTPRRAEISLDLAVSGSPGRGELEDLVLERDLSLRGRDGFQHHARATHVTITVYPGEAAAERRGEDWLARLTRTPGSEPRIEIAGSARDGREAIGRWEESRPFGSVATLAILRDGDRLVLERVDRDGDVTETVLEERKVKGERRYVVRGNAFGEYYVMLGSGKLGIYDREGLIRTARPVP